MTKCISVSEKGKSLTVIYPKQMKAEKIRIDEGELTGNDIKKCDWAITVVSQNPESIYFVELKGTDLKMAIAQLSSTIENLKDLHSSFPDKQAHAVCSRIVPCFLSTFQIAVATFKKKYDFILKCHSQKGCVRCSSCG